MRKFDKLELQRRVDEVLYCVWDPIGVCDEPYARAEYENYVLGVLGLVEKNNDKQPIADHLANIISAKMELSPNKEQCESTAELLLKHKEAIKDGCA